MLLERNPVDAPPLTIKQRERRELDKQTRAFLRAGGTIKTADSDDGYWGAWLGTDVQARQTLVSVARFCSTTGVALETIWSAVRAGILRGYIYKGERHIVNSKVRAYTSRLKGAAK